MPQESVERLRQRVRTLEEQVRKLRFSRRVLMDLLVAVDRERRDMGTRLESENRRLRRVRHQLSRMKSVDR